MNARVGSGLRLRLSDITGKVDGHLTQILERQNAQTANNTKMRTIQNDQYCDGISRGWLCIRDGQLYRNGAMVRVLCRSAGVLG